MISLKDLVKAGVHWGHLKSRWCPKMEPYIWGHKNGVHLIDVSKTANQVQKAAEFLKSVAAENKTILWVGTKRPAQEIIKETATKLEMPYVNHRWIGGTLNNWSQIKKSITKSLHLEDVLARAADFPIYTKKDLNTFNKTLQRLLKGIGGIRKMSWPIGALVLVDVNKEASALKEAVSMGIPVVAIVDTNADPSLVDYVIPANDDSPNSIRLVLNVLADSVIAGKDLAKTKATKEAEKAIVVKKDSEEDKDLALDDVDEEIDTAKKRSGAAIKGRGKVVRGTNSKNEEISSRKIHS